MKEIVNVNGCFHFTIVEEDNISEKTERLNATMHIGIPAKMLVENHDLISPFVTKIYNDLKISLNYPHALKLADITPIHKKNYRPVNILQSVSKIFEKMFVQISNYIEKYLPFFCGFCKGPSM